MFKQQWLGISSAQQLWQSTWLKKWMCVKKSRIMDQAHKNIKTSFNLLEWTRSKILEIKGISMNVLSLCCQCQQYKTEASQQKSSLALETLQLVGHQLYCQNVIWSMSMRILILFRWLMVWSKTSFHVWSQNSCSFCSTKNSFGKFCLSCKFTTEVIAEKWRRYCKVRNLELVSYWTQL